MFSFKKRWLFLTVLILIVVTGFIMPEPRFIPVKGATAADWHKDTFWYEPWGSSGVHKGIDIFGNTGTEVLAPTNILILYQGELKKGGKVILGLGPKWRLHYLAHLDSIAENLGTSVSAGSVIATLGATGNAKGKPPHLHYSIVSLMPYPHLMDSSTQGMKKAFYLNPIEYLEVVPKK